MAGAVREQRVHRRDRLFQEFPDCLTTLFARLRARQGRLDTDHERHRPREDPYAGQVLEARYESRVTASPMQR
jgi:hypothetical protein